jgi:predicted GNAT superfamily acetyltransferase
MLSEDERERMRRAYYIDHLKVSQIARDTGHCRQTVKDVIEAVPRKSYQLSTPA